ncbi:hypothetical protein O9G_001283 [Rozella allomycis CSF55]|uniref:Uncharacterized protein n=1 Tax=Rozella allomycis (strain CSF55) TaxID=988480 RepID=A0A075AXT1_ROZAC|nr:hypothetical protein O9G_001283 [Rozella allomycis CSF55]|eukprot:EPZ33532.1 hypothetical protein O9G_001283 [Rozella allomycis CSF55]
MFDFDDYFSRQNKRHDWYNYATIPEPADTLVNDLGRKSLVYRLLKRNKKQPLELLGEAKTSLDQKYEVKKAEFDGNLKREIEEELNLFDDHFFQQLENNFMKLCQ